MSVHFFSSAVELLPYNFSDAAFYGYLARAAGVSHVSYAPKREDQVGCL